MSWVSAMAMTAPDVRIPHPPRRRQWLQTELVEARRESGAEQPDVTSTAGSSMRSAGLAAKTRAE